MTRVSLRGMQLGIPTTRSGASAPVNTVAPSIPASAVIGTQLVTTPGTWDGVYTLTYQWQRNTGSWVNIAGATNANYTPVDADFGRALRVVETADGAVSANSNETGLTAEAPAQSLGAELLANPSFAAWTAGAPDNWVVTAVGDAVVTQVGSGQGFGGAGTGAANMYSVATGNSPIIFQSILTVGGYYEAQVSTSFASSGSLRVDVGNSIFTTAAAALGAGVRHAFVANSSATYSIGGSGAPKDITMDSASVKQLTLNTQLTAPSANMRADFFYTLPGSPLAGDAVWIIPRVSDFAAGNYWLAYLRYTGAQWDVNLYSVATFTRTSRIAATNIGATNGIRVNANADSWSLFTTTDGGSNWTQRGSTITNATYQANTGVNVLYTSSVTAGNLLYAPAT